MGRIAGLLWMAAAAASAVAAFLPGSRHGPIGWVLAICAGVFLYGLAGAIGLIRWHRASIEDHALATVAPFPVIAPAVYLMSNSLMGNSRAYVEPLLVVPLFYSAFFFPRRLAWSLNLMLLAVAGLPLLTDPDAIDQAFLPRYLALCVGFVAATWVIVELRERLRAAEGRQREMADAIRAGVAAGGDDPPRPGVSIGWAVFPEDSRDYETLLQAADARMLRSKRGRRPGR